MTATYQSLKDEIVALTETLYSGNQSAFGSLRSSLGDVGEGPEFNTVVLGSGNSALTMMAGSAWGPALDRANPAGGPDPVRLNKTVIATVLAGLVNFVGRESVLLIVNPFSFADSGVTVITSLEDGDLVPLMQVVVEVAFDSITADINVGTSTAPGGIFGSGEVDLEVPGTYITDDVYKSGSSEDLRFNAIPAGATAGRGYILSWVKRFSPPPDEEEE
jgi:hypothetical protein